VPALKRQLSATIAKRIGAVVAPRVIRFGIRVTW
jgi:hypothetical protein